MHVIERQRVCLGEREWQRLCNRLRVVKEAKKSMQRAFQKKFMQIIFHEEYSSKNVPHLNFAAIAVVLTPMLRTCACVRVLLCAFILYFTSGILRTCVVLNYFVAVGLGSVLFFGFGYWAYYYKHISYHQTWSPTTFIMVFIFLLLTAIIWLRILWAFALLLLTFVLYVLGLIVDFILKTPCILFL